MTPADRAVWFINNLTLCDAYLGQRMKLRPWQEDIVRKLKTVGPDGKLQYRKAFLLIPRKQSKSEMAGSFAVEHSYEPGKKGRCVLIAASDKDQATLLFEKIQTKIEADPYLMKQTHHIYKSKKLVRTKSGNKIRVLSSDGKRAHGENPSLVICDEVWAWRGRELYQALTSGFAARKDEHLTLVISTQGNRRDSLIYELYEYACKVRDGVVIDPEFLPIIYEAFPTDDWTDESVWHKAMPALGDFASLEFMRKEFKLAQEIPSEESKFRQFYLNQLVASEAKWVNRAKWDECGKHTFDPSELVGRVCYAGLDLSNTSDITALVLVFPMDDGTFRVLCHFWIPENYAKERDRKGQGLVKYQQWKKQGFIKFTPGDEIEYPMIEADIPKILEPYQVKAILADPYNATSTLQRLRAEGLPVERHRQGWMSMSDPIKYTEVLIAKGLLHHGNNPVLNWMADNAVVDRDKHDNLTFDKLHSADKIDGIVSMVMGIAGATSADQTRYTSGAIDWF